MVDDEALRAEQQAIFRFMPPGQRWEAAVKLYWSTRRLKTAFLRSIHPDWSDERVDACVRAAFLHARPPRSSASRG